MIILFTLLFNLLIKSDKIKADVVFINGKIYTVNEKMEVSQAFAIKGGKFLEVGSTKFIKTKYEAEKVINLHNAVVYPGLIDAHCHFYFYGKELKNVDLSNSKSFEEVLERVKTHQNKFKNKWIIGRGWDQNRWNKKEFPTKNELDILYPNTPVLLGRIDLHAGIANQAALNAAKFDNNTIIEGGLIEKKDEQMTGIILDRAYDSLLAVIPKDNLEQKILSLKLAEKNVFAVGLTTVDDAGLKWDILQLIDSLQKAKELKIRIYAMADSEPFTLKKVLDRGIYKTERLSVRSVKVFGDGALGSRGACLLNHYSDKINEKGFLLHDKNYFINIADQVYKKGFQLNTHCIGDSAVRLLTDIYGIYLKGKNDLRWRIEHAQVVNLMDLNKFGEFSIIPSVQPTHATSDMEWADERLGNERIKTAYAYKDLLNQRGLIASGSDFPVESINPLYGFFAAVARQDQYMKPRNGFQIENKLSRVEALKAMTIWAAFSNFEEREKGSIEKGKFADFVILDNDIMKVKLKKARNAKVIQTWVGGEMVYNQ